jgi:hypothetical protein
MSHHPTGETFDIVGFAVGNRGRSCEEHEVCGSIIEVDMVIRVRKVQIVIAGLEETALAAYWVTDGIDRCRVGFLPRHMVHHWKRHEGKIAQVIEVNADSDSPAKRRHNNDNCGSCKAIFIETGRPRTPTFTTAPDTTTTTDEPTTTTDEPKSKRNKRRRSNPYDFSSDNSL